MITKEQALTCTSFKQTTELTGTVKPVYGSISRIFVADGGIKLLPKPINWRANGKCKTWKRTPERFQLPIKHGLYNYGYITNENAHLFEAEQ